jgi:hypothetical protein
MRCETGTISAWLLGLAIFSLLALPVSPFLGRAEAQGCLPPPPGLVSWWPGDGSAEDIVGGHHGTLEAGASFAPGMVGEAFLLDGMDDHVLIGNPPELQLQNFTIDAWIKLNDLTLPDAAASILLYGWNGYGFAVSGVGVGGGSGGIDPINEGELILSKIGRNGVSSQGMVIPDLDFHHVAVTKQGGDVTFYLDGAPYEVQGNYDPIFQFDTDLAIGIWADMVDLAFPGLIDEVEVFDRALTALEIQAIVDAGSAGKCKGDQDGDGLSDADELLFGTDPLDPDTDDDGMLDGTEVDIAEGSGCPDPLDSDSDDDTLFDGEEGVLGTDPCLADSDGDGIPDDIDPLPLSTEGTEGWIASELRDLADFILEVDPTLGTHWHTKVNQVRLRVLSFQVKAAANRVDAGRFDLAIAVLQRVLNRVDGLEPPLDWIGPSPERDTITNQVTDLIALLEYLP